MRRISRPMPRPARISRGIARSCGAALAIVLSGSIGCASSSKREPIAMEPIGTVSNLPRTPEEPDDDAGVTAPNSAGSSASAPSGASAAGGTSGECAGGEFRDLADALNGCEVPMPKTSEVRGLKNKLEIRVNAASSTTTPGGRVDFDVVLRNKTGEPIALFFSGDPVARLDTEVVDGKGRRADAPPGKPPAWPKGVAPPTHDVKAYKVMLAPGSQLKVKVAWDAVKSRWAPERAKTWDGRGFPRTPAGALLVGKYVVKFPLPLIGAFEKGELDIPKVTVEVTA